LFIPLSLPAAAVLIVLAYMLDATLPATVSIEVLLWFEILIAARVATATH